MERHEKILDYIDGQLSAEDAEQVREKIATDSEWKACYISFLEMNTLLSSTELLMPSTTFVDQTMAQIESEALRSSSATSAIISFVQTTFWLWVMVAVVVFSDINTALFSNAMQQWIIGIAAIGKEGIHLLLGNSVVLWVFGALLMAYVTVRSYEDDNNLLKVLLN